MRNHLPLACGVGREGCRDAPGSVHGRDELGIPMAPEAKLAQASQNQPGVGIEWELDGIWSAEVGFLEQQMWILQHRGAVAAGLFSCRSLRFLPLPKVQPGFSISNKIQ